MKINGNFKNDLDCIYKLIGSLQKQKQKNKLFSMSGEKNRTK